MSEGGVLPVDKPEGPTSHDMVARARGILGTRRIGHTGTLDPFATGLLLLCVGPSTRLSEYLTGLPKRYLARMRLGVVTDTDDRTGAVIATHDTTRLDPDRVRQALAAQVGTISQRPPIYSAKKISGKRAHALAREGQEVAPDPVRVTIHDIQIREMELPEVVFEVSCGSGTYIRAIARDVGEVLGVGGHLLELRRTAIGVHEVADAVSLEGDADRDAIERAMLSPARALRHLPAVGLTVEQVEAVRNGRRILASDAPTGPEPISLLAPEGALVAIAEHRDGWLQPRKVIG